MGQINIKTARQGQCQFQIQCTHTYIKLKEMEQLSLCTQKFRRLIEPVPNLWETILVHEHLHCTCTFIHKLAKRALYCTLYMYRTTEVPSLQYTCIITRTKSSALGQLCRHVPVHYTSTCKVCSTITGHKNCCIFTY